MNIAMQVATTPTQILTEQDAPKDSERQSGSRDDR